jgi:hypothetical protein
MSAIGSVLNVLIFSSQLVQTVFREGTTSQSMKQNNKIGSPPMTLRRKALPLFLLVLCLLAFVSAGLGQTETATLSGLITDSQGKVVPGVAVEVMNVDTNVKMHETTNGAGLYVAVGLKPGRYRVSVTKEGFRRIDLTDLVLNVQDVLSRNFQLQLGPVMASITVVADATNVNSSDASVSTVIDQTFVSQLPLNGRSFNTLLQLTPGVVIAPTTLSSFNPGQFSIAGQRTDANSFTVDGVSANFGTSASVSIGGSGTGTAQAFSALGGTSSLVSVDDLQEFRVQTSSFAPEFGRTPGGQVLLTTRSGTNDFHGGIYDYFRNTVMDANDWFANSAGLPRGTEHHNDFGGFFGGPIWKNKTFFFLSYEGARLDEPATGHVQEPYITNGPPCAVSASIAPILAAFPKPNGPVSTTTCTGLFTGTYSNRATLNATSIRIDHTINSRFSIFGRYNYAPSQTVNHTDSLSELDTTTGNTQTLTFGINMTLSPRVFNILRGNYSTQSSAFASALDSFGGAVPVDPNLLLGTLPAASTFVGFYLFDSNTYLFGNDAKNRTRQLNFVNDVSWLLGVHQIQFGADYRAIFLDQAPYQNALLYEALTTQSVLSTGQTTLYTSSGLSAQLLTQALSLFAQDTWKISPKLTVTYGLRWELNPAPSPRGATTLASWTNVDNPAQLSLAPAGTPPWNTTYGDFAPRFGIAYSLTEKGDFVVRAGGGIFYDLGVSQASLLASYFPNSAFGNGATVSLPLEDATPFLPTVSRAPPYPEPTFGFAPDLKLPRSYQWNVAMEKSFGRNQAISATYVGQAGRDLVRQTALYEPNSNFAGDFALWQNAALSNYHALQLQYRKPLSSHLQVLLNYSWSHSLDNVSSDDIATLSNAVIAGGNYGSSDFDVRQSFSGAISYAPPAVTQHGALGLITKDWSIDTVLVARTGFPFNGVVELESPDPEELASSRPNLVPGQPLYLTGSQCALTFQALGALTQGQSCPGGKGLNPAAFSVPSTPQQGNEGRNDIPGFGLTQVDLSIARKFPIERLNLQFRADAFNVLNHPNFTNPQGYVEFGPTFLLSTLMLNHGLGGLNSLFQEGGPRSLQLSLKLIF